MTTRRYWKYLLALLIPALGLAYALTHLVPTRIGDGSEYYAMYLTWKTTLRPFMSAPSWAQYGALVDSGAIQSMVSLKQLMSEFPALRLAGTADLNHFWFYSGLTAFFSAFPAAVGLKLAPHSAFLLTHAILFALVLALVLRLQGWKGFYGVLLLTACSPMIWFIDKVHTEFFTFCFVLGGVIAVSSSRYFLAALLLAIASTQNISFAAVAFVPLMIDLYRRKPRAYSFFEIVTLALAALAVFAHPTYYFFRYGAVDPQFLAGGAKVGGNLKIAYIWLLDPDVGLLPNWPLGVVLIGCGLFAIKRLKARAPEAWGYIFFCLCYLAINLPAQSSTENLNSGGTPGLARYATWYIPLFYPLAALLTGTVRRLPKGVVAGLAVLIALSFFFTIKYERPQLSEAGYITPSPVSRIIQTYIPALYDPPAEIFSERFSGIGESPELLQAYAVVGPDCRKVLLLGNAGPAYGGPGCGFDPGRLVQTIRNHAASLPVGVRYFFLTDSEAYSAQFVCPQHVSPSKDGNLPASALSGFSTAEQWGRWSDDRKATLKCIAPEATIARIHATSFSPSGHKQRILVTVNHSPSIQFVMNGNEQTLDVPIARQAQPMTIRFDLPDAISPKAAVGSADERNLALGIRAIDFIR